MSLATMTKKSAGRPKGDRDDVPVRLPRALASRAKALAEFRGIPVAELLTQIVEKPLTQMYIAMLKEQDPAE